MINFTNKIEIDSFPKFLEVLEQLITENEKLWFRGIASLNHKLAPTIFRTPFTPKSEELFQNQFRSRAIPFLKNKPKDDYWEWLFIMQHHGVPTRLLDWSSSALVALAFAVIYRESKYDNEDAGIWCLNPYKLNSASRVLLAPEDKTIPDISVNKNVQTAYSIDTKLLPGYPIAITGPLNNDRIVAQKGTFTLFPNIEVFNLEEKPGAESFLTPLIIKKESIPFLKKHLHYLGVTESTIFPDLNSLALEIKREFQDSLITSANV